MSGLLDDVSDDPHNHVLNGHGRPGDKGGGGGGDRRLGGLGARWEPRRGGGGGATRRGRSGAGSGGRSGAAGLAPRQPPLEGAALPPRQVLPRPSRSGGRRAHGQQLRLLRRVPRRQLRAALRGKVRARVRGRARDFRGEPVLRDRRPAGQRRLRARRQGRRIGKEASPRVARLWLAVFSGDLGGRAIPREGRRRPPLSAAAARLPVDAVSAGDVRRAADAEAEDVAELLAPAALVQVGLVPRVLPQWRGMFVARQSQGSLRSRGFPPRSERGREVRLMGEKRRGARLARVAVDPAAQGLAPDLCPDVIRDVQNPEERIHDGQTRRERRSTVKGWETHANATEK